MSPLPVTPVSRRHAEAFDAAVRGDADAARATASDARTAELLSLVRALRETPAPAAHPAFVTGLRERLVLAAETELAPARRAGSRAADRLAPPALPQLGGRIRPARERRLAAALTGLALVGASATMAVASQSSLPGDTLYPLKRVIEDADTTLRADGDQGTRLLQHAASRLVELQAVSDPDRDTVRTPVLESTVTTFTEQADEAAVVLLDDFAETGEVGAVDRLRVFTADSLQRLGALEPVLPAAVRPELMDAAATLLRIDAAADRACPQCAAGGIVELPSTLMSAEVLDPVPGAPEPPDAPAETTPAPTSPAPARTTPPRRSPSPSDRPTAAAEPPATAPASPKPPVDTTLPLPPAVTKPPSPAPTREGLLGGLVDGLTGGGQGTTPSTTPSTPTPTPLLPGLGGLLDDTLGGLGRTTGTLLP